jgi:hypothetical protein
MYESLSGKISNLSEVLEQGRQVIRRNKRQPVSAFLSFRVITGTVEYNLLLH